MRIWATIRKGHRIIGGVTLQTEYQKREQVEDWAGLIGEACHILDLSRPVILRKHLQDIDRFGRAIFKAADFMEPIAFDRLEIEAIVPGEKKKKVDLRYYP